MSAPSSDLAKSGVSAAKPRVKPKPSGKKRVQKPLRARVHMALRSLHLYSSMATLLLILFFSVSGLLLNHPEWLPSGPAKSTEYQGQLKAKWLTEEQTNWLQIVEELRAKHSVKGRATDMDNDGDEATINFVAPGREAEVVLEVESGKYEIYETSQGLMAIMGDLHRGKQAGDGWKWVIDISALFLVFISATGFGILLYMKKMRRPALLTLVGGGLLSLGAVFCLAF